MHTICFPYKKISIKLEAGCLIVTCDDKNIKVPLNEVENYLLHILIQHSKFNKPISLVNIEDKLECEYKVKLSTNTVKNNLASIRRKYRLICRSLSIDPHDIIKNTNKLGYYINATEKQKKQTERNSNEVTNKNEKLVELLFYMMPKTLVRVFTGVFLLFVIVGFIQFKWISNSISEYNDDINVFFVKSLNFSLDNKWKNIQYLLKRNIFIESITIVDEVSYLIVEVNKIQYGNKEIFERWFDSEKNDTTIIKRINNDKTYHIKLRKEFLVELFKYEFLGRYKLFFDGVKIYDDKDTVFIWGEEYYPIYSYRTKYDNTATIYVDIREKLLIFIEIFLSVTILFMAYYCLIFKKIKLNIEDYYSLSGEKYKLLTFQEVNYSNKLHYLFLPSVMRIYINKYAQMANDNIIINLNTDAALRNKVINYYIGDNTYSKSLFWLTEKYESFHYNVGHKSIPKLAFIESTVTNKSKLVDNVDNEYVIIFHKAELERLVNEEIISEETKEEILNHYFKDQPKLVDAIILQERDI